MRHQPARHTPGFMKWFPLGPLTPAEVGDSQWISRWDSLDQFGRLAWDWRMISQQLEEAQASSGNVRVYRFEDIFGDDGETVEELVNFAAFDGKYEVGSLEGFRQTVHNASSGARDDWRDWPVEKAHLLDEICGELMRQHGYGSEPEWLEMLSCKKIRGETGKDAQPD